MTDAFGDTVAVLVTSIANMIAQKHYTILFIIGAFAAQAMLIAPILARRPTSLRKDFVVGHSQFSTGDLPYTLVKQADDSRRVDMNETCLNTGIINIGWWGKYLVAKCKYMVSYARNVRNALNSRNVGY